METYGNMLGRVVFADLILSRESDKVWSIKETEGLI